MTFIESVLALAKTITGYQKGRSGEGGLCDCIGLIIGALKKMGISWGGTHGSNYAARYKCGELEKITSASSLSVDDIVFKMHKPTDSGYDADTIRGRYKNHPDQNDYYHVGVVVSVSPLDIIHCSTGGIKHDIKLGNWTVKTTLNCLKERNIDDMARSYFVHGGVLTSPIHMRKSPSTSSPILKDIPQDSIVDFLSENDGWAKLIYDGITGFVKNEFVKSTESGTVDKDFVDPVTPDIRQQLEEIDKSLSNAVSRLNAIWDIIGRG